LWSADDTPTLLGFGGNAWKAGTMALTLHRLFPDRDVVAFHYRGYSPSGGKPSTQALLSDSLTIFDYLRHAQASVVERIAIVSKRRRARLDRSPRERPESGRKPPFNCGREISFTARSGSSSPSVDHLPRRKAEVRW
jgi:hypothetical protein